MAAFDTNHPISERSRKTERQLQLTWTMRHQEDNIGGSDFGLALLVIVAAWLLIFQATLLR